MAETLEGVVEEILPQGLYRVGLRERVKDGSSKDGRKITVSLGGSARQTTVRVIPGDRVLIEVSTLDPTRGKIMSRLS